MKFMIKNKLNGIFIKLESDLSCIEAYDKIGVKLDDPLVNSAPSRYSFKR